jgi:hypothetical protein
MGDQNAVGAREHWRLQIFAGFAPVNGLLAAERETSFRHSVLQRRPERTPHRWLKAEVSPVPIRNVCAVFTRNRSVIGRNISRRDIRT